MEQKRPNCIFLVMQHDSNATCMEESCGLFNPVVRRCGLSMLTTPVHGEGGPQFPPDDWAGKYTPPYSPGGPRPPKTKPIYPDKPVLSDV